jgi:hypothetical protein
VGRTTILSTISAADDHCQAKKYDNSIDCAERSKRADERCTRAQIVSMHFCYTADCAELHRPEHIRCLMGYVVDLTLILQAVWFQNLSKEKVTPDRLSEILYEFVCSGKKDMIHADIVEFVGHQHSPPIDDVVDKIELLIKQNAVETHIPL